MAHSPSQQEHWALGGNDTDGPPPPDIRMPSGDLGYERRPPPSLIPASGPPMPIPGTKPGTIYREKQIKRNKVYIGGLPEHTRTEDLQACFGQIGNIQAIELKLGYGFVEFETRTAAEESVAKYHEGYFMGNKIRVELSHGGGKTAKFAQEPGACFKCGQQGHWARECPNHVVTINRRPDAAPTPRTEPPREFAPPPPPTRDYGRDDFRAPYPPPPGPPRYPYDMPQVPRDYGRRPPSPPRGDYRDYLTGPPRSVRDYDDYRRGPPTSRYDYYSRPPPDFDPYLSRGPVPSSRAPGRDYDRLPVRDYPTQGSGTGRDYPPPSRVGTGPGSGRDYADYPRARSPGEPPADREYSPEYRGRTPPPGTRYSDYPANRGGSEQRYRRRSQSPAPRSAGYAPSDTPYQNSNYTAGSGYHSPTGAGPGGPPPLPTSGSASSRTTRDEREYPVRTGSAGDVTYRRN